MTMTTAANTFSTPIHARWSDMDQNAHMRTTALLAAAEDARMQYFAAGGFPIAAFQALGIGPVVQRDELSYRAELRLHEKATITMQAAGLSADNARFRLRNVITRDDGIVAVVVTSTGGWLDLGARRLTSPPSDLAHLLATLEQTDDFEELPALKR